MCGIAGKTEVTGQGTLVRSGMDMLKHRGPDETGLVDLSGTSLGIQRLAIVDLSEGVQPVWNERRDVVIVCNGEIYNHVELAVELKQAGHEMRSRSDVEVIPHLYEDNGKEFARRLRGMFAIALWDVKRECLILARDRFGKKPLYYLQSESGAVVFASELKALKAMLPGREWRIQEQAIYDYLSLGSVPQPASVFEGVQQVPPGTVISFKNGRAESSQFWEPFGGESNEVNLEIVRNEVSEAVRLRLRSDVPVGVFLSGGLDSSIVALEAAREVGEDLQTFTVQVDDAELDESTVAVETARQLGVRNEVLPLEVSPLEDLQAVIRHYDQPFADSSALPSWALARAAAKRVKVVLNGDGGDELFGGYRRHLAAHLLSRVGFVPTFMWRGFGALLPGAKRRSAFGFLRRFVRGAGSPVGRRYLEWGSDLLLEEDKQRYWQGDAMRSTEEWVEAQLFKDDSNLQQQMFLDRRINLLSDLLVKMDMATMAHSLEARSPFLDHKLAECAFQIPDGDLLRGGETKSVLRRAYEDRLPQTVVRGPKRGFEAPVGKWLNKEWRELLHDNLGGKDPAVSRYLDRHFLRDMLDDRLPGDQNVTMLKYTVMALDLWLREQTE